MATVKTNKFYDIERDGITQGLLSKFMECRQLTRWFLQGWSPKGTSLSLLYGEVVHAMLERAYGDIQTKKVSGLPNKSRIQKYVNAVEKTWKAEHTRPDAKTLQMFETALMIAEATLPIYFEYWNKDLKELAWESLEQEFKVPYTLPDGRKTFFRGKMDGVFKKGKIWLFETKTKAQIQLGDITDMLPFELQVNLYLWVLRHLHKKAPAGVLYNIVRKIGLKQRQDESMKDFAKRCADDIYKRPDGDDGYFHRLEVSLDDQDLNRFEGELQDMVTDFYNWWEGKAGHYKNTAACISKYGRCKYLNACAGLGMHTYEKRKQVFRELEDV